MKIKKTSEITQMLNRCKKNFYKSDYNSFLGLSISPSTEIKIKRKLNKIDSPEFTSTEDKWPSLYLSSDDAISDYHKQIKLDKITENNFTFQSETISANILFNSNEIIDDPQRELNDYLELRALKEPITTTTLRQNGEVWMLDVISESKTIDKFAEKAQGKVLTMGLGIGYFIFQALKNPKVTSITVIEYSLEVINMFKNYILPQFNSKIEINIIHGDAYKYFNKEFLDKFDYVFVDIYQSNQDGLYVMNKMLGKYNPPFEKLDFWIEGSTVETMHGLIYLYFENLIKPNNYTFKDKLYQDIYKKIAKYFSKINIIVDDCETLKYYMYDRKIIREIFNT